MSEETRTLPELLADLDEEYRQLKQNPSAFPDWTSSTANVGIQTYILRIPSTTELEEARLKLLGKSGRIPSYFSELRDLPLEIRSQVAAQINPVKSKDQKILEQRQEA